jgi:hypothetical protein
MADEQAPSQIQVFLVRARGPTSWAERRRNWGGATTPTMVASNESRYYFFRFPYTNIKSILEPWESNHLFHNLFPEISDLFHDILISMLWLFISRSVLLNTKYTSPYFDLDALIIYFTIYSLKYQIYSTVFRSRCFDCLFHDLFPHIPDLTSLCFDLDVLICSFKY